MHSFSFTIFFLLSCALSPLSCASAVSLGRRHLNDDAALPTPLSATSPPFFPLDSSVPPPPPPTFAAFPTFPANISALVLPRSSKPHPSSPTLLVPALSALLAVATAIGLALFLYGRWRGQQRHLKETESSSSSSHGEPRHVTNNFSVAAPTSTSEVFYLGKEESRTCFVNSDSSPEIRPLPPLPRRSFQHNYEAHFLSDEEEEEFFSPLASLPGSENSSPSRPGLQPEGPYSTSSCSSTSSSRWVSPARSFSITISPNPRYSFQSPSPDRLRVRNDSRKGSSLRMFSFWNQNIGFPRISSASTSPDRATIRTYSPSSVSTSPDGFFRKFLDSSPPIWTDFSRNVKSVLLSSASASSRRDFVINIGESSSRILNPEFARRQQSQAAAPSPPTRPPPLVPPSQPFVVEKNHSLSELPPKQLHWDRLRSSSFKLNKEMVETLFIANSLNPNMKQRGLTCDLPNLNQETKILEPRKAQNIATMLQLLDLTTKDVCQALLHGDYDALGTELLESLSRLAPSEEEERKLKSFSDESVNKLGLAERFLKELLHHVPFVFQRVDALLYVANFHAEIQHLRRSLGVVQAACEELRSSRMFSILLEAVLKTGRKMNVRTNRCGPAHAFKLDMLLKLVEMKGLDGRSSLLHFVVQEVIKSEGTVKALDFSLEGIGNLSSELVNVKRSAYIEYGVLRSNVSKLYQGIKNIEELLLLSEERGSSGDQWLKFRKTMARFLETAAGEIVRIETQERSTVSALEEVAEHFHGDSAEKGHTLRIFMIVRDFLSVLDKVCNEMGN